LRATRADSFEKPLYRKHLHIFPGSIESVRVVRKSSNRFFEQFAFFFEFSVVRQNSRISTAVYEVQIALNEYVPIA
jgi:hypothetical protein